MSYLTGFSKFFHESQEEDLKLKKERVAKNFMGQSSIYAVNVDDDKTGLVVSYSDQLDDATLEALKKIASPWPITLSKGQPAVMHES